jgi:hypothetical protein
MLLTTPTRWRRHREGRADGPASAIHLLHDWELCAAVISEHLVLLRRIVLLPRHVVEVTEMRRVILLPWHVVHTALVLLAFAAPA